MILCSAAVAVCADADQIFIQFSADIKWLKQQGGDQLPVLLLDDTLALAGRYPAREESARWFGALQERQQLAQVQQLSERVALVPMLVNEPAYVSFVLI